MDPKLYKVLIIGGDQNSLRELSEYSDQDLLRQVTFQNDTVLHVAAKFRSIEIAEKIIDRVPLIMYQKNSKGDTPLHIAARLGCQEMAEEILKKDPRGSIEVEANEKLVRMVNMENDTALHEAARSGHSQIVKLLIEKDPELLNLANDKGESPLFIAVDKKHFDTAILICNKAGSFCSYRGRNNMNALHAVIVRLKDDGLMYLSLPVVRNRGATFSSLFIPRPGDLWTEFRMIFESRRRSRKLVKSGQTLVTTLITKCPLAATLIAEADNFGWTPLHCAAHLGYSDIVKKLLQANRSTAYSKTSEGMSALHIAAKQGHVCVLRELHQSCPGIWDLQDGRGRTALHVAAESGKVEVVKHNLKWLSKDLINQKDMDGNTPLHLATIRGHHSTLALLTNDRRIDKTAMNKNGLSVIDIIQSKNELSIDDKLKMSSWYFLNHGLRSLEQVLHAENTGDQTKAGANYDPKYVHETEESKLSDQGNITDKRPADTGFQPKEGIQSYKRLGEIANTNLLVTTLIATVSFAAAFSVPGGFRNDGPEEGMATLIKKTSYKAFILTNALAFIWSMRSIELHYGASLSVHHDPLKLTSLLVKNLKLTGKSKNALLVAFITGSYAALDGSGGLAVAVLVLAIGFLRFVPFVPFLEQFVRKFTGFEL